ncbi:ATP-binding cassette domain-containing protein [Thalassospira sp. MA62]|nr:ATP-binding cassette domain-containing protein [Thalassospira sp. MA62]
MSALSDLSMPNSNCSEPSSDAVLSISDLSLRYAKSPTPVLWLDALTVRPGETVGIAGPSGSGKSSLLYLLSGLLRPTTGKVVWGDIDLTKLSEGACDQWRHRSVGFVFQDFHLIDEISPLENVLIPVSFSQWKIPDNLRTRAKALLDQVGVPQNRKSTADLSRGEQQRVAIARALLFDPPIILADEPTASLDKAAATLAGDILFSLGTPNRTIIIVSHDHDVIDQCGRVIGFDKGQLVRDTAQTTMQPTAPLSERNPA